MELITQFFHIDVLTFLGHISLGLSIIAFCIVVYHWRFFNRVDRSQLGKRMALVFLSDIAMYISIALYGLNWVIFDGGSEIRIFLKAVQVGAVAFNLYALSRLMRYYAKVN